jgi:hypothetical protein
MKKKIGILFVAALISLFSLTTAQAQNTKGEAVVASQTVTATVTKINQKTREVSIKATDGQVYKFIASSDVQNLAQVKKGDVITVVYTEALAYEVKKSGTTGAGTTAAAAAANPGEKPAGAIAQQTTVTVKITAINTKTPSVTVEGPDGDVETIKVKDPSKLNGLKVGDMVDITYTEALAIKVDAEVKK